METPTAKTLDEAREFFLKNSSGQLECVDGDRRRIVDCYPDARTFFQFVEVKADEPPVRPIPA